MKPLKLELEPEARPTDDPRRVNRCRCEGDVGETPIRSEGGSIIGYRCRRCGQPIEARCPYCRRGPFKRPRRHLASCRVLRLELATALRRTGTA